MLARSLVGFWTCEGFLAGASSAGYMRAAFGMATAGAREVCQGKAQRSEAASRIDAARASCDVGLDWHLGCEVVMAAASRALIFALIFA